MTTGWQCCDILYPYIQRRGVFVARRLRYPPSLTFCPHTASSLTDGLEALQRVGDAEEVLPVDHSAGGVREPSCLLHRWEMGGAVDQPEALILIQQDDACRWEGVRRVWSERVRAKCAQYAALFLLDQDQDKCSQK